jgi:hypothetical protein
MARTAVVAGTATAVSNRVSRRQASRWQQQEDAQQYEQQQQYAQQPQQYAPQPAYAPPPAPAPTPDAAGAAGGGADELSAELQRLAALNQQGVLSDAEFAAAKAKLLGI